MTQDQRLALELNREVAVALGAAWIEQEGLIRIRRGADSGWYFFYPATNLKMALECLERCRSSRGWSWTLAGNHCDIGCIVQIHGGPDDSCLHDSGFVPFDDLSRAICEAIVEAAEAGKNSGKTP